MLDGIVGTIGSIVGGGVTGLIGTGITALTEYKGKQNEFQHQQRVMELGIANKQKVAGIQADSETFTESLRADKAQYATGAEAANSTSFVLVDLFRGLVRPTLTVYVMVVVTLIYMNLMALVGGLQAIPMTEALAMLKGVIDSLLYITTTIVLWWFGSRNKTGKK